MILALLAAAALAAEPIKPAAEVSASSGPVKLTLRVYKTQLKVIKEVGAYTDDLWVQLEIKNIGDQPILIKGEDIFNPKVNPMAVLTEADTLNILRLELRDSKGRLVTKTFGDGTPCGEGEKAVPNPYEPLNLEKIYQFVLQPGESRTSTPFVETPHCLPEGTDPEKAFPGVPGYMQITEYALSEPGTYTLRAVYKHNHGQPKRHPEEVNLKTPPLKLQFGK